MRSEAIVLDCAAEAAANGFPARIWSALCSLGLYIGICGAFCSMASLSDTGVLPLSLGAAAAAALPLLRGRASISVTAAALCVSAALAVLDWAQVRDGVCIIINRLCAASEASQSYSYPRLYISAAAVDYAACIRRSLAPIGLLFGTVCGLAGQRKLSVVPAVVFSLYAIAAAYLGVPPSRLWCIVPAAAVALGFCEPSRLKIPAAALAFAFICLTVTAAFPGENAYISSLDESLRDSLASYTAAYSDESRSGQEPTPEPNAQEQEFHREEDSVEELGDGSEITVPVPLLAAILTAALLLFVPAVFSDLIRRRRERNRAGFTAADNAEAIRGMFAYALRWLSVAGFEPGNRLLSDCSACLAAMPEGVREGFNAVLPLWQEAVYSEHNMSGEQRELMRVFADETASRICAALPARKRLLAKYYHAL